ncbi:MAG: hypothetical protein ABSG32_18590 [Terriglobia bacterium]
MILEVDDAPTVVAHVHFRGKEERWGGLLVKLLATLRGVQPGFGVDLNLNYLRPFEGRSERAE